MIDHFGINCADLARVGGVLRPRARHAGLPPDDGLRGGPRLRRRQARLLDRRPVRGRPHAVSIARSHVAFAADAAAVRAFYAAALDLSASAARAPRLAGVPRAYYGAFVRDPDGNNVEAVRHTAQLGD